MSQGWQAAWLHGLLHSLLIRSSSFSISYIYLNNISLSIYLVYLIDLICNALQCHMDGKQPGYMVSHILYSSKTHLSHIFISIYLSHYILIYPVYLNISYVMPCNVTRMAGCPAAWSPAFSAHQRLIFLNLSSSVAIFDRFWQVPVRVLPAVDQHHSGVKPVEESVHCQKKNAEG